MDEIGAGGAIRTAGTIMKTTAVEAAGAARVIWGQVTGRSAAEESVVKIRKGAYLVRRSRRCQRHPGLSRALRDEEFTKIERQVQSPAGVA